MIFSLQTILFCLAYRQAGLMISCTKHNSATTINNNDTIMNNKQYTWLALGDSYTIGESVNIEERFPAQTIGLLQNDSLIFSTPKYIATTGWTTQKLLDAVAEQKPAATFNVVTLLIGVNDQYQHRDTTGYREKFTACLQKAIELAGIREHVFVISIPDYSVTPFAMHGDTAMIRKQLDEFNAINKEVTISYQISYTDITQLTREAKTDSTLIAGDGLHPSGKEYAKWAALLAPEIAKVLK